MLLPSLLRLGGLALLWSSHSALGVWQPPLQGIATLTHYDLPANYVASCGCVGRSTRYPTAALNALAYGGTTSFAPSCGACYSLTLLNTSYSPPPPVGDGIVYAQGDSKAPNVVVKITDLCPLAPGWCNATETQGNTLGSQMHFDLAWPSQGISKDFFPGDHDYGVWWTTYERVDCKEWNGNDDKEAVGSEWDLQNSACCPSNPLLSSDEDTAVNTSSTDTATAAKALSSSLSVSLSSSSPSSSSFSSSSISARSIIASQHRRNSRAIQTRDKANDSKPQEQTCPSYSEVVDAGQSLEGLVPNTSNILSSKDDYSNAATSSILSAKSHHLYRRPIQIGQWLSWLLAYPTMKWTQQRHDEAGQKRIGASDVKRRCGKEAIVIPQYEADQFGEPPLLSRRDL